MACEIPGLLRVPALLCATECEALIAALGGDLAPSEVGYAGLRGRSSARTSYGRKLADHELGDPAPKLAAAVSRASGLPPSFRERWELVRYRVGECFAPHVDFLPDAPPRSQRLWTALLMLRPAERGGATRFPLLQRQLNLSPGELAMWRTATDREQCIEEARHEGEPVIAGEKWILVSWVRASAQP